MQPQPQYPQPHYEHEMKGMLPPEQPPPGYGPPPPQYVQYGQQPPPPAQTTVVVPGPVTMVRDPSQQVPDNMVISIISIFFCCILGIIATVKANNAKNSERHGNIPQAIQESNLAKKLAIAAIVTGIVITAIVIFVTVILPLILAIGVVATTSSEMDSYGNY